MDALADSGLRESEFPRGGRKCPPLGRHDKRFEVGKWFQGYPSELSLLLV